MDIPRLYTALAEWAACMVYLFLLRRRCAGWKFAFLSGVFLLIQSAFLVLTDNVPLAWWIPCMIAAAGIMYIFLVAGARITWIEAGYCCACAFLIAETAAAIEWQFHSWLIYIGLDRSWALILLLVVIYSLFFLVVYRLEKVVLSEMFFQQLTGKDLVSAVGIVIVIFAFSNMSYVTSKIPFTGTSLSEIFNIHALVDMVGAAALYAFQSRIGEYLLEKERDSIQAMLKSQYDQYRNYQKSMEMIHIKYHDLKHQIAGLRAETDVEKRQEWVDAMERELEENTLIEKTGNHVLDNILGAKLLQAKEQGIRITCVADGTLLNFMHVTDICTVFGNALDNALESVVLLEDPEMRLIHVSVSAQKNFVLIQVSNYCGRTLKLEEGKMPQTTKPDKRNHGFGLKSIRYSVEKYGGSVAVDMKKNWFELRILIPKQKTEE